ncbi:Hypothetical protein R9X50_00196600 [Acrodontium crateriforme]|uniref:Ribosomal RNA-processing protein 8 n=1 Tax=Acrodontium crateriforme TaxID=150365 RepID=A0AAQ3M3D0_9PEZI|nr:Hypothetical protein R9X50_00196600 [Acrodontium crateriforme]
MFAVKGWSVDASSLKPQTEIFRSSKKSADDVDGQQSRKRKRPGDPPVAQQQGDVGKLWEKHIEGKTPEKSKAMKDKKKKRKVEKAQAGEDGAKEGTADGEAAPKPAKVKKDEKKDGKGKEKGKKNEKGKDKGRQQPSNKPSGANDVPVADRNATVAAAAPVAAPPSSNAKLTPMQAAMRQKLISARFRHLNETLYTAPSREALDLFNQNPEMFEDYHSGFRQQVTGWPENPVDNFIATLRARGSIKAPKGRPEKKPKNPDPEADPLTAVLPRTRGTCIIADLGCGDARLASTLTSSNDTDKLQLQILSYDLHSPSKFVTKADISALPTADGSVDVAIFCLALMGTNWISFIEEAYRILHWKGELWIAEIKSRFGRPGRATGKPVEHSVGGKKKQAALAKAQEAKRLANEEHNAETTLRTEVDGDEPVQRETDVSAFIDVLRRRGFVLKNPDRSVDLSNKMFVKMEFIKAAAPTKGPHVSAETERGHPAAAKAKKRFLDEEKDGDMPVEEEAKVLKPCLYKIR